MAENLKSLEEAMNATDSALQDMIEQLKQRRIALGLSQAALGKIIGIDQARISTLERKKSLNMSLLEFVLYANVLGFKMEFGGRD